MPRLTIFSFLFLGLVAPRAAQASLSTEAFRSTTSSRPTTPSITSDRLPSPTSSPPVAATHTISVGNGAHVFRPDITLANVGDIIEFAFYPVNHSVVRAEYTYPCIPYEMTGQGKTGFFSGFNPVKSVLPDPPKYRLKINDSSPIFFYCSAIASCMKFGMVGAINPNTSTPLSLQHNLALKSSYMLQPGEPFPAEASLLPPSTSSPSLPDTDPSSKHGLSTATIAGIGVGVFGVLILGALLFFFIGRSHSLKAEVVRRASTIRHGHSHNHDPSPSFYHPQSHVDSVGVPAAYYALERADSEFGTQHCHSPGGESGVLGGMNVNMKINTNMGRASSYTTVDGTLTKSPSDGYYTMRMHEADGACPSRHVVVSPGPGPGPDADAEIPSSPVEIGGTEISPAKRKF